MEVVRTAVITALLVASVSGQLFEQEGVEDCNTGPPPPSDLRAFIWWNSGFNETLDEEAARERLQVDFLCQESIHSLRPYGDASFSAVLPLSDINASAACTVPLETSCNLLSSCSPVNGGRRLSQCMPFFGCPLQTTAAVLESSEEELSPWEILVEPPQVEEPMHPQVSLGICFDGMCSIFGIDPGENELLAILPYSLCPEKYANTTARGWTPLHWTTFLGISILRPFREGIDGDLRPSIRALVKEGADLEATDVEGFTPLHLASKWGAYRVAEAFIDLKADVEAKDAAGNTPLATAAAFGRGSIIELLLEAEVDPNVTFVKVGNSFLSSKTPLHFASLYGRMSATVDLLIQAGADVNSTDDNGDTPLDIAKRYGRVKVMEMLKEAGAR